MKNPVPYFSPKNRISIGRFSSFFICVCASAQAVPAPTEAYDLLLRDPSQSSGGESAEFQFVEDYAETGKDSLISWMSSENGGYWIWSHNNPAWWAMQLGSDHTLKIHDTDPDVNTGNSASIILSPGDGSAAASITLSGSEVITASNAPVLLDPAFMPRMPNEAFLLEGDLGVGNIPAEGVGQRMMWYPGKAAFRAGGLTGYGDYYWDQGEIGEFSIAMGRNVQASGEASVALGLDSGSLGGGAFAAAGGVALGYKSSALGGWNYAYGESSVALGNGSQTELTAYGAVALAGGYAVGNSAVATGGSTADGDWSVALNSSGAIGDDSTSMGWAGALGDLSVAMGKTEVSSYTAVALGQFNEDRAGLDAGVSWQGTEDYSVFEVGIGDDENAKANALTVLQDGSVEVGKATNDADPARRDDVPLTIKSDGSVILAKPQGDISMGVFGD